MSAQHHFAPIDRQTSYAIVTCHNEPIVGPFIHEELGQRVFDVVHEIEQTEYPYANVSSRLRLVKIVDLDEHASDWRDYGACLSIERAFLKRAVTDPEEFAAQCRDLLRVGRTGMVA